MIVGLSHIHVVCSDLAATESWFVGGLGAELVERRESRGLATGELLLARVRVLLRAADTDAVLAPGGERRYALDHFTLHVDDIDGLVELLRARGVEIEREPADSPRNRVAFISGARTTS